MTESGNGADERATTLGSDFLQLDIGEAPPGGRADWLARRLRLAMSDGRLPVGSRLPPTRVLATELGVSRGVVTEAYQRLVEDGQVAGRGRAGTVVVAVPIGVPPPATRGAAPAPPGRAENGRPTDRGPRRDRRGSGGLGHDRAGDGRIGSVFTTEPGVGVFDSLRAAPARLDLTPGVPDLAAFPRAAWLRAERAVFDRLAPTDFGYGDPTGTPALRLAVAAWLARNRGVQAEPEDVVIVAGVAQALGLLAQVLRDAGLTRVAVEDPGSLGARQQLEIGRLDTPAVPVDAEGIRVHELRASGAPAVMLTPAHQFPTGVVLSGGRRRELMRWAADGGLILEDDYDAEHRYDRPPVPALKSVLPERVCYTGSVSKLLAPALRVGWVLAPRRFRDALVAAKRNADLGNAALPQVVLAELMRSGELERHLRFVRRRHVRRRNAMIDAIGAHLPGAVTHGAAAGLHLTITFDGPAARRSAGRAAGGSTGAAAGFGDVELAAAALERGVKVQPLSWHRRRPGPPGLVLGYAASTSAGIAEGVALVGDALREIMARDRRVPGGAGPRSGGHRQRRG